jgi:hypothetical protein
LHWADAKGDALFRHAKVAELADALDSGSSGRKAVGVRLPPFATKGRALWRSPFFCCERGQSRRLSCATADAFAGLAASTPLRWASRSAPEVFIAAKASALPLALFCCQRGQSRRLSCDRCRVRWLGGVDSPAQLVDRAEVAQHRESLLKKASALPLALFCCQRGEDAADHVGVGNGGDHLQSSLTAASLRL